MFTGIVRSLGIVTKIEPQSGDLRLSIRSKDLPWQDYHVGESISVNGVCLTAAALLPDGFEADVSAATIEVTALRYLSEKSPVNLEPALAAGERLGGHFVNGHVDCVGTVTERKNDARSVNFRIDLPGDYRRYLAQKGSVCVDGVSLTINEVSEKSFGVNIIPHTAETTIIGGYQAGTRVNIEVDLLARYLDSLLQDGAGKDITREFLRAHGYA